MISEEAAQLIADRAGSDRKRGEWISAAIVDYVAITEAGAGGAYVGLDERLRRIQLAINALTQRIDGLTA